MPIVIRRLRILGVACLGEQPKRNTIQSWFLQRVIHQKMASNRRITFRFMTIATAWGRAHGGADAFNYGFRKGLRVGSRSPIKLRMVLLAGAALIQACGSRRPLDRQLATTLILSHEENRYGEACRVSFQLDDDKRGVSLSDLRTAIGAQLGDSICSYSVLVNGIALTTETTRSVVFTETRTYDMAKAQVLLAYVNAIFARMSVQPIRAAPDVTPSLRRLVVVDPLNGRSFFLGIVADDEVGDHLKRRKLKIDDVWDELPPELADHRHWWPQSPVKYNRIADVQLFDDGWRVTTVR